MNLGKTITTLRQKKNLKQTEMADMLGITHTYLSQVENNHKTPNVALLEKIAKTLNTPLPFLFFFAVDEKDIPEHKAAHFRMIEPLIKQFLTDLMAIE
ncbi:helix-turn-helix domain-containing protein [Paraflavitalea pollutisoli]|uniref:helix-turn-helix domain-containing protein n=1 Tax=Paraflavitalea pollutisoli TaxID=3034143 RepID=UPI0023ED6441|nr:helix-turn-helix transcriptional regulator [Paraflavitalea sp. H1-2-19X]